MNKAYNSEMNKPYQVYLVKTSTVFTLNYGEPDLGNLPMHLSHVAAGHTEAAENLRAVTVRALDVSFPEVHFGTVVLEVLVALESLKSLDE